MAHGLRRRRSKPGTTVEDPSPPVTDDGSLNARRLRRDAGQGLRLGEWMRRGSVPVPGSFLGG